MKRIYISKLIALLVILSASSWSASAQTSTYNYTGGVQSYTVPTGISSVGVDMSGACGGNTSNPSSWGYGGAGGRVQCTLAVTGGEVLYLYVGQAGTSGSGTAYAAGGWNGGGTAGNDAQGGGGGGASDIRLTNSPVGTYSTTVGASGYRILVAGGGAGAGAEESISTGGAGGGTTGGLGWMYSSQTTYLCYQGTGGSQTTGGYSGTCETSYTGSLGIGCGNATFPYIYYGGGGGGGYYGGGAGYEYAGGGGGSSYPAASGGNISNLVHTQGYNGGSAPSTPPNGYITIVGPTPFVSPTNLNFGPVTVGTTSNPPQFFQILGTNMPSSATNAFSVSLNALAVSNGYEISADGITWGISIPATNPIFSWTTSSYINSGINIYVEYNANSIGTATGSVLINDIYGTPMTVTLNGTGATACNGSPTAGSAVINGSTTGITAGGASPITLSLSGSSASGGLTYQWQQSTNGGATYNNIPAAVLATYNTLGITTTTTYRCQVICTSGTTVSTVYSAPVTATFSTCPIPAAGCLPNCSSPSTVTSSNFYVQNTGHPLSINGANGTSINDGLPGPAASASVPAYIDRSCTYSVTLGQGTTYTISYGENTSGVQFSGQIFIDFNNNGTFEASETVGGGTIAAGSTAAPNAIQAITIPANAPLGIYRMRVVWAYNGPNTGATYPQYPGISGCTSSTNLLYGDNRDYSVSIVGPQCAGTPNPGIVAATPDSSCSAYNPTLFNVGVTSGAGMTYQWQVNSYNGPGGPSPTGWINATGSTATASVYNASIPATPGTASYYYYRNVATCNSVLGVPLGSATSSSFALKYNPPPSAIIGATGACSGKTVNISSTPGTGVWTSSDTTLMSMAGSSGGTGLATGVALGTPTITYTLPTGCYTTYPMTVNTNPGPITGNVPFCVGTSITLGNAIGSGTWNVFGGAATINNSTGLTNGISGGTATVSYSLPTGCLSTATLTVNALPTPGIVSVPSPEPSFYCLGNPSTSSIQLGSSQVGVKYQLYLNGTILVDTPLNGTGSFLNWGIQSTPGAYTVVATNAATTCTNHMISSASATITVIQPPLKFDVTGSGSYCANPSGIPVGLDSSQTGVNYAVYEGGVMLTPTSFPIAGPGLVAGDGHSMDFGNFTSGIYNIVATNSAGCVTTQNGDAIITANPLPTPHNVSPGGGYCGGSAGVDIQLDYSSTGITYSLYDETTASTVTSISGTGAPLDFGAYTAGNYIITAQNATTLCSDNMTGTAVIYLNPLPNIYTLSGGGSYCAGGIGSDIYMLPTSDPGTNYQLYLGGSPVGSPVPGTGGTLDFGYYTTAGTYTAVAVDGSTSCTDNMSGSASISINPLPAPFVVTGGGNYCAGGTGKVVGLSGSTSGVSYTWTGVSGGATVNGPIAVAGTGSALNFGLMTIAGTYTVSATSSVGGCTNIMTGNATIGINPLPSTTPNVTESAMGNYCAGGVGVDIGLDWSNTGVSYQLVYAGSPAPGSSPVSGVGGPIDFGNHTATGLYTVKATNVATGCQDMMTGSANVNVNPLPNVHNVTGGGNYCATGAGKPVSLDGSDAGVFYQLRDGITLVGTPMSGTGTGLSYGLQTAPGTYTVFATDSATGCTNNMNGGATILVNPLPNVYTVTGGGIYCFDATGVHIGLGGSNAGVKYQLYDDGVASGSPISGTGFAIDFGLSTDTGLYTIVATFPATTCSSNMSGSTVVATNPLPNVYTVTGGGSYCVGGSGYEVDLSGSDPSINYQLYYGTSILGTPVAGTGSALSFGTQTLAGSYTVSAINTTTGCKAGMSSSANITINPLPLVHNVTGGGNFCAGGTGVNVFLDLSNTGVNYQLYNGSTPEGAVVAGTGAALNFGLMLSAGTYTAVATDGSTGCTNNMNSSATVVVNPLPGVHTVTGGGAYCLGGTGVPVGLDNSDAGVNYLLSYGGVPVSSLAGTGSALNFGLKTGSGSYTVTATNTATSCVNNMNGSANIAITPPPTAYAVTGGGNYCATGFGLHIGLANSDIGVNYQLMLSGMAVSSIPPVPGTGIPIDFGLINTAGNYTVYATDPATTCNNNMGGSATIGVIPVLLPHVAVTSSDTAMDGTILSCAGAPVSFSVSPINGGSAPTYQWMVNGINAGVGTTFSYTPTHGDIVTAMIHSNYVCAIPDTGSTSIYMNVSPPEMPSASVSVNPGATVCTGTTATFTANPLYGGSAPSYTWLKGGSTVVGTGLTYSYVPMNGDIITFELGSNFPCRLSSLVFSDPVTMVVENGVIPTVAVNSSAGVNSYSGQTVTFTATASNAGASPTYQWYINGLTVAGANSSVYTTDKLVDMDSVSCDVVGQCGLVGTNSVVMHVSGSTNVSVQQITSSGSNITLAPNPNKGAFTVKGTLSATTDQEVSLEVTDMLGQSVYTNKVMTQGGNINEHIQLNNTLANGMYILNLRSATGNAVFHFVIEQ